MIKNLHKLQIKFNVVSPKTNETYKNHDKIPSFLYLPTKDRYKDCSINKTKNQQRQN